MVLMSASQFLDEKKATPPKERDRLFLSLFVDLALVLLRLQHLFFMLILPLQPFCKKRKAILKI